MVLENGFPPYPDFLKIFNSHEDSQLLVIPRSYNRYYPNPLPQTAVLKNPEGRFWNVQWTKSQEVIISLQEGWVKFVKDNGLIDRDFLLFTYDGSRSFWVRIHRNGLPLEPTAPIKIQEISDDEDETNGDGDPHMEEEGDTDENMIVSLSLGSSDEVGDDDDDDYDTAICDEVNKASGSSKKGRVTRKHRDDSLASITPQIFLADPNNPFFISTSSCSRRILVIARQVIKDYGLNFDGTVNLIDGFGELTRKVGKWKDRVVIYKWNEMFTRNKVKQGDVIICEIIREEDVVRSIKVHFVKN
ncbi:B3 domain-containing protein [Arabidopsis thaliana]|uniref:B3 domain-containing protein At5g57720 n=4 Tax=Arabidopsis TaxID=3701 RepID=Y5772_ARATH|nr:AP2/B3-like transcriptional factor family protein [Arabidopsis thaliana]Q9FHH1.1 RecName: Full=B3 domain-containing protein At5g57720 [Arabidopsis thaliana]KAG7606452.1 DNA-binding pseudobarrel domain superfamily [Arabidopsis thaliana x Arabidopsis arenosa]KAG7613368.1 DNA-binding pseudobarrel domain superfamily [Arabidopsis suecica]AED96942.1 AP2/B3-like transcriptional factor family protein [Arabidopsis thaliana]OAO94861.1 hypothetical protein AXX17_AT5G57000 [Arabidopsis thaliana]CAA041|eukprot:NP_200580.1 AP2/B3-like transcriptional factor family protein [Arabidopsis thaliana]